MTGEGLRERMAAVDFRRPDDVRAFFDSILAEVRRVPREAVDLWFLRQGATSVRAGELLFELGELAIVPLLESEESFPRELAWLVRRVADAELDLRRAVVGRLEKLLVNKTLVPPPSEEEAEEPAPPCRVCDEAFLQLRRLLVSESVEEGILEEAAYLERDFRERDLEISRYFQSKTWRNFTDEP